MALADSLGILSIVLLNMYSSRERERERKTENERGRSDGMRECKNSQQTGDLLLSVVNAVFFKIEPCFLAGTDKGAFR